MLILTKPLGSGVAPAPREVQNVREMEELQFINTRLIPPDYTNVFSLGNHGEKKKREKKPKHLRHYDNI